MDKPTDTKEHLMIIEPRQGKVPIDFREIWNYRELFYFLTKRDIQVRYKQTVLGGLWAIIPRRRAPVRRIRSALTSA